MNKFFIGTVVALLALLALGVSFYILMPKCQPPEPLEVAFTQLKCAQEVDLEEFRADACNKLHGTSDCEFEKTDLDAVFGAYEKIVDECALKTLKSNNKCTDKYEGVK